MSGLFRDYSLELVLEDGDFLDIYDIELEMFTKQWWLITLTHLVYVSIPLIILLNFHMFNVALFIILFNFHEVIGAEEEDRDALDFFEGFHEVLPVFSNLNMEVRGMDADGPFGPQAFQEKLGFLQEEEVFEPFEFVFDTLKTLKEVYQEKYSSIPPNSLKKLDKFSKSISSFNYEHNFLYKDEVFSSKNRYKDFKELSSNSEVIAEIRKILDDLKKSTEEKMKDMEENKNKEENAFGKYFFFYSVKNAGIFDESYNPFSEKKTFLFDSVVKNINKKNYMGVDQSLLSEGDKKYLDSDTGQDAIALKELVLYNLQSMGYYKNSEFDYYYFEKQLEDSVHIQDLYKGSQNTLLLSGKVINDNNE